MAKAERRRSLEETWRHLECQGEEMPRDRDGRPFVPPQMPSYEDEEPLGFSFFGRGGQVEDYSGLTLPRTYFGHSTLDRLSFAGTDLSGSRMCWNDFLGCDFSGADLSGCDMRSSTFRGCRFAGAVLRGADLRRSYFEDCDFAGADLTGALVEEEDADGCVQDYLSSEQCAVVAWQPDGGPEPPGG
jgi:BTB/POZ domain-containing protein KCTD9